MNFSVFRRDSFELWVVFKGREFYLLFLVVLEMKVSGDRMRMLAVVLKASSFPELTDQCQRKGCRLRPNK
jgi:hypothetical protein